MVVDSFSGKANKLFGDAQIARDQLLQYISRSSGAVVVDHDAGIAWKVAPDGSKTVDNQGTKLLNTALVNETSLDSLYSARKAGLISTGSDAAQAYVATDRKPKVAQGQFDKYSSQIGSMVASAKPMSQMSGAMPATSQSDMAPPQPTLASGASMAAPMPSAQVPQPVNHLPMQSPNNPPMPMGGTQ